jgi:hypothetical protein
MCGKGNALAGRTKKWKTFGQEMHHLRFAMRLDDDRRKNRNPAMHQSQEPSEHIRIHGVNMTYMIKIGDKVAFTGIRTEREASAKCCLMMAMSPRLDIFYYKEERVKI